MLVTERDGSSWVVCIPNEGHNILLPNLNGARVGDNVVFVWEPSNPFDPSCVKVDLSREEVGNLKSFLL